MPTICCVFGCGTHSTKENPVPFHGFPKNPKQIFRWKCRLRIGSKLKWSAARVCGKHFSVSQYDDKDTRRLKRNAVPDLNLPRRPTKAFSSSLPTTKRIRKRPIYADYVYDPAYEHQQSTSLEETMQAHFDAPLNPKVSEINNVMCSTDLQFTNTSRTYSSNPSLPCAQYAAVNTFAVEVEDVIYVPYFDDLGREEEIYDQDSTTTHLDSDEISPIHPQLDPDSRFLCLGGILATEGLVHKDLTYLCGLTKIQFDVVYSLCIYNQNEWPSYCIPLKEQLLLTLLKYRHNWEYRMLSIIFKLRPGTAQTIFIFWTRLLYNRLEAIDFWKLRSRKDGEFVAILDCTEIPIEKPAAPDLQQATFSKYKNTNTFKMLVAIDEQGVVTFVSDAYGGCVSDNRIVELSGIVDLLSEGDYILADRGFEQIDVLSAKGIVLNRPPTKRGLQLTEADVAKTRAIASRRIEVERVIGYAKTYKILSQKVKHTLFPYMNMIIKILFKLTNIRPPICKIRHDKAIIGPNRSRVEERNSNPSDV